MKLYENNLEALTYKILLSNNLWTLLKAMELDNKDLIVLSPLTKIKDLFNFQKNSSLFDLMNQIDNYYETQLINQKYAENFISKINQTIGFEVIDQNFEIIKLLKTIFEIKEDYLDNNQIINFLNYLNQFSIKNLDVVLVGFGSEIIKKNFEHLNLFILTSDLTQYICWDNLETLVICQKNDFIEIESKEILLNWLEMKTRTSLTLADLDNYFQNKYNFNSFLIEKAFRDLK